MYLGATYIDQSMEPSVDRKIVALYDPLSALVPLAQFDESEAAEPPTAEPAPETGATPDAASESAPKE